MIGIRDRDHLTDLAEEVRVTIIGAIVSRDGGVVASDGRVYGSAPMRDGAYTLPPVIESDEHDKTFVCCAGRINATHSGLMRFSGKSVPEHVSEFLESGAHPIRMIAEAAGELAEKLPGRLESIDDSEVSFENRKLDLLLIGHAFGQSKPTKMVALSFRPEGGRIAVVRKDVSGRKANRFHLFGDDSAQAQAKRVLESNDSPRRDVKFLCSLLERATREGIANCGVLPGTAVASCGGKVFIRAAGTGG